MPTGTQGPVREAAGQVEAMAKSFPLHSLSLVTLVLSSWNPASCFTCALVMLDCRVGISLTCWKPHHILRTPVPCVSGGPP